MELGAKFIGVAFLLTDEPEISVGPFLFSVSAVSLQRNPSDVVGPQSHSHFKVSRIPCVAFLKRFFTLNNEH